MPRVKEKETMGSYAKFNFNKGKNERNIEIIINGNKEGASNEFLSKITKLSIKKITSFRTSSNEEILKNVPNQDKK